MCVIKYSETRFKSLLTHKELLASRICGIDCVKYSSVLFLLRFLCQRVPFPAAPAPVPGVESMSECKYLTQTFNGRQVQDRNYVTSLLRTNINIFLGVTDSGTGILLALLLLFSFSFCAFGKSKFAITTQNYQRPLMIDVLNKLEGNTKLFRRQSAAYISIS